MSYQLFHPQAPYRDRLPGGLSDAGPPPGVDLRQVMMGIRVEMEHTSDPELAREIAYDHLREDPKYYDHLEAMERFYSAPHRRRP